MDEGISGLTNTPDWLMQLFSNPGPASPALGKVLATAPETIVPHLVEAGLEPPDLSTMGVSNPMEDMSWFGGAGAPPTTPTGGEGTAPPGAPPLASLASGLAGVHAPTAPTPQHVSSPPPYRPSSDININSPIAGILSQMSGASSSNAPQILRLAQALGGR